MRKSTQLFLKLVITTIGLIALLLVVGIFVCRLEEVTIILADLYLNFSWGMFVWILLTGFAAGLWAYSGLRCVKQHRASERKHKEMKIAKEKQRQAAQREKDAVENLQNAQKQRQQVEANMKDLNGQK